MTAHAHTGERRIVLDTSGHRPLFEQPDDLDYLTDVVVLSTAQLPRS
jgi:hypothetical protein